MGQSAQTQSKDCINSGQSKNEYSKSDEVTLMGSDVSPLEGIMAMTMLQDVDKITAHPLHVRVLVRSPMPCRLMASNICIKAKFKLKRKARICLEMKVTHLKSN